MDRLTERDEYGNADIIALSDIMPDIYSGLSFSETNFLTDALNRLAEYEDTGLDPAEIKVLSCPERRGHWLPVESDVIFACSNCENTVSTSRDYENSDDMFSFCPYCGARMDGRVGNKNETR